MDAYTTNLEWAFVTKQNGFVSSCSSSMWSLVYQCYTSILFLLLILKKNRGRGVFFEVVLVLADSKVGGKEYRMLPLTLSSKTSEF